LIAVGYLVIQTSFGFVVDSTLRKMGGSMVTALQPHFVRLLQLYEIRVL
jgi:hypothetical protein